MADIILVEDNRSVSRAYQLALESDGHTVRISASESELVRELEVGHPDLLLLDIGLPGVDGLEILRTLRQESGTALKVAVLSNYSDRGMVHRALKMGALEYVEKASTTPTLLTVQVRRWLER
ncbi:MAG TPA: response regulator [Candidatus Dormibacteraeota bacterium]|nr:response regulator [Candidatus Dormibacteraeota bacterium]